MPLKVTDDELMQLKWIRGQMALEGRQLSLGEIAKILKIGQHVDGSELTGWQKEALKIRGHIPAPAKDKQEETK